MKPKATDVAPQLFTAVVSLPCRPKLNPFRRQTLINLDLPPCAGAFPPTCALR